MAKPPNILQGKKLQSVLQIGCADPVAARIHSHFKKGWKLTRIDPDATAKPEIVSPFHQLPKVKDTSFDAVWASYILPRLLPGEASEALKEWLRVLKPGGMLALTTPDLALAGELASGLRPASLASSPLPKGATPIDLIYGHAIAAQSKNGSLLFRNGYTSELLVAVLKKAGFTAIRIRRERGELTCYATRPSVSVPNKEPVFFNADQPTLPDELDREPAEWDAKWDAKWLEGLRQK